MEILAAAQRRQDCNERPDPEAVNLHRKTGVIPRGRALMNVATYLPAGRCVNEAMGQLKIKNLHVEEYDAGESFKKGVEL